MTAKIGQRWLMSCVCHEYLVEITRSVNDNLAKAKVLKLIAKDPECSLRMNIGDEINLFSYDKDWQLLLGQDAPTT